MSMVGEVQRGAEIERFAAAGAEVARDKLGGGDTDAALLEALAAGLTTSLLYLVAARGLQLCASEPLLGLSGGEAAGQIDVSFRARAAALTAEIAGAEERFDLTAREAEVLALMADGSTNREIAAALVISVRTAEHHVAHILRKLGAPDRRTAVGIARGLDAAAAPPLPPVPRRALTQHAWAA